MKISRQVLQQLVVLTGLSPHEIASRTGFPLGALNQIVGDMAARRRINVSETLQLITSQTIAQFAKLLGTSGRLDLMDKGRVIHWTFPAQKEARKHWMEALKGFVHGEYQLDATEPASPLRYIFSTSDEIAAAETTVPIVREMVLLQAPVSFVERLKGVRRTSLMIADNLRDLRIYVTGDFPPGAVAAIQEVLNPQRVATFTLPKLADWAMSNELAQNGVMRREIFNKLAQSQCYRYTFEDVETMAMQHGITPDKLIEVMFSAVRRRAETAQSQQPSLAGKPPVAAVAAVAAPPQRLAEPTSEPVLKVVAESA